MKYLKRIFETKINVDELKDFCEGSLAFLMDEGFEIQFIELKTSIRIELSRNIIDSSMMKINDRQLFMWNDIKDDYISFIHKISKIYQVNNLINISYYSEEDYRMNGRKVQIDSIPISVFNDKHINLINSTTISNKLITISITIINI